MLRPACVAREDAGALELGLRRLDEVGGAADHRRREGLERLHHLLAGVARGDVLAGRERRQRLDPAGPRLAGAVGLPVLAQLRERLRPALEAVAATPARPRSRPAARPCARRPRRARRSACPGRARAPPSAARTSSSPSGEPCDFDGVDRLRRAVGDVAADDDQRRALLLRLRRADRRARARPGPPSPSTDCTCQPCASKRFALSSVVKRERGRAVDRDVVVVVEVDELAEAEVAGDRRRLAS